MSIGVHQIVVIGALIATVGCSGRTNPAAPSVVADINSVSQPSSTGGTMKETLSGRAIASVVPEGQALADESRFVSGGGARR